MSMADRSARTPTVPSRAHHGELLQAGQGLFALANLVDREPRLRKALTDPAVSPDAKRSLPWGAWCAGAYLRLVLTVAEDVVGAPAAGARAGPGPGRAGGRSGLHGCRSRRRSRACRGRGLPVLAHLRAGRELRRALTDPVLPLEAKQAVVAELLERQGVGRDPVAGARADRARADARPRSCARGAGGDGRRTAGPYRRRGALGGRAGRGRRQRLAAALEEAVGRPVELHVVIDPDRGRLAGRPRGG